MEEFGSDLRKTASPSGASLDEGGLRIRCYHITDNFIMEVKVSSFTNDMLRFINEEVDVENSS